MKKAKPSDARRALQRLERQKKALFHLTVDPVRYAEDPAYASRKDTERASLQRTLYGESSETQFLADALGIAV